MNEISSDSYLKGVSNSPLADIVTIGSYVSGPSWGDMFAYEIK